MENNNKQQKQNEEIKAFVSVNDLYENNNCSDLKIGVESIVYQCNYDKLWDDVHNINPELVNIDNIFPLTKTQAEIITNFYTLLSQNSKSTSGPTIINNNSTPNKTSNNNNNNNNINNPNETSQYYL